MVLEEATAKAKSADFTQVQEDRSNFFRELLCLVAPQEFQKKGFFEAWVRSVEDCRQAAQASQDPYEVIFPNDLSDDDNDPEHLGSTVPIRGDDEVVVMKILIYEPAPAFRPSFSVLLCSFSFSY